MQKIHNWLLELDPVFPGLDAAGPAQGSAEGGSSPRSWMQTAWIDGALHVTIDATAQEASGEGLLDQLQQIGLQHGVAYGNVVSGFLPMSSIGLLEDIDSLAFARPSLPVTDAGSVISQDVRALRADFANLDFGVDGSGVKIGIMSDSFDTLTGDISYANDVARGELPADILLLDDLSSGTDEGRAMAQLINDIAPGAELMFATAFGGQARYANNIDALVAAGADIIVDDVFYTGMPFFQDGIVAQAAARAVDAGVSFFSSGGNSGVAGYEAPFRANTTGVLGPSGGFLHDWDTGPESDPYLDLTLPDGTDAVIVLQWDQPYRSGGFGGPVGASPGSASDLNFYLTTPDGVTVLQADQFNNFENDPVAFIELENTSGADLEAALVVESVRGPLPGTMRIVGAIGVPNTDFVTAYGVEYVDEFRKTTTFGHKVADGVVSVGAAPFYYTPAFGGVISPVPETFSSLGDSTILFDEDGNRLAEPEFRQGIDVVASDRGNTTFFGPDLNLFGGDTNLLNQIFPDGDPDPDVFPNFSGTSASAPNAAAVAALMLQVNPRLSPTEVEALLKTTAIDINLPFDFVNPGFNFVAEDIELRAVGVDAGIDARTGAGLIDAQAAVAAVLSGTPTRELTLAPTTLAGDEGTSGPTPFDFTISRSGEVSGTASVSFSVEPGNGKGSFAADASDFAGGAFPSGDVSFAAGQRTATLSVSVAGDSAIEDDETFTVVLDTPVNAVLGDRISATGIIRNDDVPPPDPVALDDAAVTTERSAIRLDILANDTFVPGDAFGDPIIEIAGFENRPDNFFVRNDIFLLPSGALIHVDQANQLRYDPNGAFDGLASGQSSTDSFSYTIRDANDLTTSATVSIRVTGLAPVDREVIASQDFNDLTPDPITTDEYSFIDGNGPYTNNGANNQGGPGLDFTSQWLSLGRFGPAEGPAAGDDEDAFGVNASAGANAPDRAPDGSPVAFGLDHNFILNDPDGQGSVTFDSLDLSGYTDRQLSISFWVGPEGTYTAGSGGFDPEPSFSVSLSGFDPEVGSATTLLFQARDQYLNDLRNPDDGTANWRTLTFDLEDAIRQDGVAPDNLFASVALLGFTDQQSVFIDDVIFSGVPVSDDDDPAPVGDLIAAQDFNDLVADPITTDSFTSAANLTNGGSFNTGGPGIDFFTRWTPADGSVGPTGPGDGEDAIGVNWFGEDNAPDVSPDGTVTDVETEKNFVINDPDGFLDLRLEPLNLGGFADRTLTFSYWVAPGAVYDGTDKFEVFLGTVTAPLGATVIDLRADDLNAARAADDGTANWTTVTIDLEDFIGQAGVPADSLQIMFSPRLDGEQESIFIDDIEVRGTAINRPPVAANDEATTSDVGDVSVDLLANDTDPDGDALTLVRLAGQSVSDGTTVTLASGAQVTVNGGSISYDTNGQFDALADGENATEQFSYQIADGRGNTDVAFVTISVTGTNAAPNAAPDTARTDAPDPVTIDVLDNDTDAEGDALEISALNGVDASVGATVTLPSGALVRVDGKSTVTYDPNGAFDDLFERQSTSDSFTYTIRDPGGATGTATVTVGIDGEAALPFDFAAAYPISGSPAPDLFDESGRLNDGRFLNGASLGEGIAGAGAVLDGVDDYLLVPDSDAFDLAAGAVTLWFKADGLAGTQALFSSDAFGFGPGGHITATLEPDTNVSVRLQTLGTSQVLQTGPAAPDAWHHLAVNWGPETGFEVYLDGALAARNASLTDGIEANTNPFTFGASQIISGEASADTLIQFFDGHLDELAIHRNGLSAEEVGLLYQFGLDGLEVAEPQNRDPVVADDFASTGQNGTVVIDALANDFDPNGDVLTITAIGDNWPIFAGGAPVTLTSGALVFLQADGTFRYETNGAYDDIQAGTIVTNGWDYRVEDGRGGVARGGVFVNVTGVNDAPQARNDVAVVNEDQPFVFSILANDFDPDDTITVPSTINGQAVSVGEVITLGSGALLTIGGGGIVTYDPSGQFEALRPGESRTESFTYTIVDSGGLSDTATVSVTVGGVNDAPVAIDDSGDTVVGEAIEIDVLANDSDIEGDPLAASVLKGPANGTVKVLGSGLISYAPNAGFTGTDTFSYRIDDGAGGTDTAAVTVTVTDFLPGPRSLWLETFDNLPNGAQVDGGETAWTTDESTALIDPVHGVDEGTYRFSQASTTQIGDNSFLTWRSEAIDTRGADALTISFDLSENSGLEATGNARDFLRLIAVTEETRTTLFEQNGDLPVPDNTVQSFSLTGFTPGDSLIVEIEAKTSADVESYFLDNLEVVGDFSSPSPAIQEESVFEDTSLDGFVLQDQTAADSLFQADWLSGWEQWQTSL